MVSCSPRLRAELSCSRCDKLLFAAMVRVEFLEVVICLFGESLMVSVWRLEGLKVGESCESCDKIRVLTSRCAFQRRG